MTKYEYIVFDLGNTLIRFDHNISASKFAALHKLDVKKIYDTFFDSHITRPFERGHISPKDFYKMACELLGFDVHYDKFVEIWSDIFWEDEKMCSLARALKEKYGYKVFLFSNINILHFEFIRKKFDIINIFDDLILSYEVGAIKPEFKIFDTVIKKASGQKDKLLYIDDREDLINAAKELGIDSIKCEGFEVVEKAMREKGVLS